MANNEDRTRVVLMRWWWLRPWKQIRILAGNLDACREATDRFARHRRAVHPPSADYELDIGPLAGEALLAALLTAIGRTVDSSTIITNGSRPLCVIAPYRT